MITHRLYTKPNPEPPVRFYRTVAISFLILTVALLGIVIFITSKKATIIVVAKEDAKNVSLVVNLDAKGTAAAPALSGVVTSTVFRWSEKYFPTGNKIATGTATGEIVIRNQSNTSQPLVRTTRFLTPGGVLFRLSEGVTVPSGGQVTAKVYADQPGPGSDIATSSFTIPGLSEARQQQVYGESLKPMSGGSHKIGILSEEDLKAAKVDFAEKIKAAYLSTLGTLGDWDKKLVAIADQNITSDHAAGEEIGEFNLSGTATIVVVLYKSQDMAGLVNKEIGGKVDTASEKILSVGKEPQVTVVSYDLTKGTAQLNVTQQVSVTLDANAEKLSLQNFLGKNKDEIERYVLGLNHVSGVEVQFSPSWMQSAPSVPDRVKIIVKNIQ